MNGIHKFIVIQIEATYKSGNNMETLFRNFYTILLEDVGNTFNINCHTFDCLAYSYHEAIGKMVIERPDLNPSKILTITQLGMGENEPNKVVYERNLSTHC